MEDDTIAFTEWLLDSLPTQEVQEKRYRHRRLDENRKLREPILPRLKEAVRESLADMIQDLINPQQHSLDHLPAPQRPTVADLYPRELPDKTKMGYFGEFFAGILCAEFEAFGESNWEIPAYLFRWHEPAIRYLERVRDKTAQDPPREVYGRQGDDCLAFLRDENGVIVKVAVCEAKCLQKHEAKEVKEAHGKLSKSGNVVEDRIQVIKILECRHRRTPTEQTQQWIDALYSMELRPNYERYDLVCYIYGNSPVRKPSWISRDEHSSEYTGGRRLEAIEVCIQDIGSLVLELYGKPQCKQNNEQSN